MDDAEAEAALLALGEWDWEEWDADEKLNFGSVDNAYYMVGYVVDGQYWKSTLLNPRVEGNIIKFPALDTAKAACERHRATGKWE